MKTNGTRTILIVVAAQLVILISSLAFRPSADAVRNESVHTELNESSGISTARGQSSVINSVSFVSSNKEKLR